VQTFIKAQSADRIKHVGDTTKRGIVSVLAENREAGGSVDDLSRAIRKKYKSFSVYRSMMIARTETGSAAGYGAQEAAKQSGIVETHTWVSARDDRVRDAHKAGTGVDGQTRTIDQAYSNGLQYPGDFAGSAAQVIHCRCVEQFGTKRS
jgi:SPP1 gp7 family putative phage head morphogenesis protein